MKEEEIIKRRDKLIYGWLNQKLTEKTQKFLIRLYPKIKELRLENIFIKELGNDYSIEYFIILGNQRIKALPYNIDERIRKRAYSLYPLTGIEIVEMKEEKLKRKEERIKKNEYKKSKEEKIFNENDLVNFGQTIIFAIRILQIKNKANSYENKNRTNNKRNQRIY